jgi:hypothetical protein
MQTFLVIYGIIGAICFLLLVLDYKNYKKGGFPADTQMFWIVVVLIVTASIIWPFTLTFCLVNYKLGKRGKK